MGLTNCSKCNALFVSVRGTLCPQCMEEEERQLETVSKYLKQNPQADLPQVEAETGVDQALVMKFLREKKILLAGGGSGITCEACGTAIKSGRFCLQCSAKLTEGVGDKSSAGGDSSTSGGLERNRRTGSGSSIILNRFQRK